MTHDPTRGASNASDNVMVGDIPSRIAVIESRLKELTKQVDKPKESYFKRISESAGLIVLFLTIAGGGFAVFDKLVTEPEKNKREALNQLQKIVGDLTKVNSNLARLSHQLPIDQFCCCRKHRKRCQVHIDAAGWFNHSEAWRIC